jgi:putative DNA primase/helicase
MEELIGSILSRLEEVRGPDHQGNYTAYCPFHNDGKGIPPHNPNLKIYPKGFNCIACNEHGNLRKLAEKLGIEQSKKEIEKTYDYLRADGRLNFQVVRYRNPKTFSQRRPDGKGGWHWDMMGIIRTLYKLPELLQRQNEIVFIVEGEKDVESLFCLGLLATTNPGGAGKWDDSYSDALKGRDVIIIPDNDIPGKKHAENVANSLIGKASSIKIIELPGIKQKGDVSDWLKTGQVKKNLLDLCKNASPIEKASENKSKIPEFNLTDLGNAERMVYRFGRIIRYSYELDSWFLWDGKIWAPDKAGRIRSLAHENVKEILHEKVECGSNDLIRRAMSLQTYARISGMINEAKPMTAILPTDFDRFPILNNCENGIIDLSTRELLPHNPDMLLSKKMPVIYDPNAKAERWLEFLNEIMLGDKELIAFLKRLVGYSLTGDISEQCFIILYGSGENGKSTFLNTIMTMMGSYALTTPPEGIMIKKYGTGIPIEMARLPGIRLTSVSETESGQRLAESLIKQFTGGEEITARPLYGQLFSFKPVAKIWIQTNHKPDIRGRDHAIWRRVVLIPFNFKVNPANKDRYLLDKLQKELPGVLKWGIDGFRLWQEKGLMIPEKVKAAVEDYRQESDILGNFLSEVCEEDHEGSAKGSDIRQFYIDWCKGNNEDAQSPQWLGKMLSERYKKAKDSAGNIRYYGIRLKPMEKSLFGQTEDIKSG